MRYSNRDEKAEELREIINNYARNPEYINPRYTQQQAIEALDNHYKRQYLKLD